MSFNWKIQLFIIICKIVEHFIIIVIIYHQLTYNYLLMEIETSNDAYSCELYWSENSQRLDVRKQ